jgi:hypothetical protein
MKKGKENIRVYGSSCGRPHVRTCKHLLPTSRTGHYFCKHFISNNKRSQSRQVKPNPSRNNFATGKQPANIKITKRTQLQKFDLACKQRRSCTNRIKPPPKTNPTCRVGSSRQSLGGDGSLWSLELCYLRALLFPFPRSAFRAPRFDHRQLIAYQHPKNKCQPLPTYAGGCPYHHFRSWPAHIRRACCPKSKGARVCDPQRRATTKMHNNSPQFRAESACCGSRSRVPAFGGHDLQIRPFRTRRAKSSGEIHPKPYRSIEV